MRHAKDPHCAFCNGSIDKAVFAQEGDFLAIYNAAPILPGHSLIIPRSHVPTLLDLEDSEIAEMVGFSRVVVGNLIHTFRASGFNWTIQEGVTAGQTVPHLHLHLIPRSEGDLPEPGDWYPRLRKSLAKQIDSDDRPRLGSDEMAAVVARIRADWQA